jgi:hypothetical protein
MIVMEDQIRNGLEDVKAEAQKQMGCSKVLVHGIFKL